AGNGVSINFGASNDTIGGSDAADRNLISGNADGVRIATNATSSGILVQGNYIGTDADGATALSNVSNGVTVQGSNVNIIGNVLSGNGAYGAQLLGDSNTVQGNLIGTQADGIGPLGNPYFDGILIAGSNDTIGGVQAGQGNTIAFNYGDGVAVQSGTGNSIRRNSIYSNFVPDNVYGYPDIGIDLGYDGVTLNNSVGHGGPNLDQNFPVITRAVMISNGAATVTGTLQSDAPGPYAIDLFSNAAADPSGYGQGQTYLDSITPTFNSFSGLWEFTLTVAGVSAGMVISATATDAAGNTSEFSKTSDRGAVVVDAPSVAAFTREVSFCGSFNFTAADFSSSFSDPAPGDAMVKIMVPTLPSHGTLMLGGVPIAAGQELTTAQLSSLSYVPAVDFLGNDSFTWTASDGFAWAVAPAAVQLSVGAVAGQLRVPAGVHAIGVDLGTLTPGLTLDVLPGAALTLTVAQRISVIHIESGASARLAAGAGFARTGNLSIDTSGQLDLCDNDLILDYTGPTPLTTIRGWLHNGAVGTGPSIITSTASPTPGHPTALGLVDNALLHLTAWDGQTLTTTNNFGQLIVKHTYAGDTNLDGKVTQADYLNILANMGRTGAQWFEGDLDQDGIVTTNDLALVSANLGVGDNTSPGPLLPAASPAPANAPTAAKPASAVSLSTRKPAAKTAKTVVHPKKQAPHQKVCLARRPRIWMQPCRSP
ncbi:MAG: hypothetical protein ACHRHE_19970, partial [Tepidisphaerales bacterium]